MAQNYMKFTNGKQDPNVKTVNGKLTFSIPLCQLESPAGATFPLILNYRSNFLKQEYSTWSEESTSGLIATGWNINIGDRIYISGLNPVKYGLFFNGVNYGLEVTTTSNDIINYKTQIHSELSIYFNSTENVWHIFIPDGTEYLFGSNDRFNSEKGTYSKDTGTYTLASPEYTNIRKLISSPDDKGIPLNASADNTICRNTENTLFGLQNWVGPTYDLNAMNEKPNAWLLSHIKDKFDNTIAFSYIQHISNLYNNDNSKTYSIASYLYKVSLYCQEDITNSLIFHYAEKEATEYNIDYTATARPNGMQQKFEKLFIKKIEHIVYNQITEQFVFESNLVAPSGTYDSHLSKRQLIEIKFIEKDSVDLQYIPSYQMTYYGEQDNVSVGNTGFDNTLHPYFNAKTGALYGNLKSIIYPTGEKRTYKYKVNSINSVNINYFEHFDIDEDPIIIHTPYNYSIVILKSYQTGKMTFYVFTWTITGWKKELLLTRKYIANYDYERFVSYSEHLIGVIVPFSVTDITNSFVIFKKFSENDKWVTKQIYDNTKLYGPEEKLHISVSEYGFAVTGLTSDTAASSTGIIYYAATDNFGNTFYKLTDYNVSNILGTVTANYTIALKVLKDRCLTFVLVKEIARITPEWWLWPEYSEYDRFHLKIGGRKKDNTILPISDLGANEGPYISDYYNYHAKVNTSGAFVFCGRKIERLIGVEQIGNFFTLNYKTRGQTLCYINDVLSHFITRAEATEQTDWSLVIMNQGNFDRFQFPDLDYGYQPFLTNFSEDAGALLSTTPLFHSSVKLSGNGMIYTIHYEVPASPSYPRIEKWGTFYFTYLGGSKSDFIKQINRTSKNLACVIKDDTFASFVTQTANNVYQKTYYYLTAYNCHWEKFNIGTISQASITYNKNAELALEIIEYIGLALSIALLPFGLGEVAGLLLTVISLSLTASSFIAQNILEKSAKSSLNLTCSYYGRRFINDGSTIWFRENEEDRFTAIGSGEAYQPYDSLSGVGIKGNVLSTSQQYGNIYGYVPFFTDTNRLYYRTLKNNAVSSPFTIGGLSGSCSDLYFDETNIYAYQGIYVHKYNQKTEFIEKTPLYHPHFKHIDACCILKNTLTRVLAHHILTFCGDQFCYTSQGTTTPPHSFKELFKGCQFNSIDCALEKPNKDGISTEFYIFSGNEYELIKMEPRKGFLVTESGTLDKYKSNLGFDYLDAAFIINNYVYYINNNLYKKFDWFTGALLEQGSLGNDIFIEYNTPKTTILNFTPQVLSTYNKSTKAFELYKNLDNTFYGILPDYVVDTVSFYTDPRGEDTPQTITKYQYTTDYPTYSQVAKTSIYPSVEVTTYDL